MIAHKESPFVITFRNLCKVKINSGRIQIVNKHFPEKILHGIHIGEHGFDKEATIDEIRQRCVEKGYNYVVIRPEQSTDAEHYIEWAKYMAENQIYFMFLYTIGVKSDGTKKSSISAETIKRIYEVSGEYFLGDVLGEPGSGYTFKGENYFPPSLGHLKAKQNELNLVKAEENYLNMIKTYLDADKKVGIKQVSCVEATMFSKYDLKAGVNIPILEMMVGDPEKLIAGVRGAAKANDSPTWGTYVAQEWYGGRHHEDILKRKRMMMAYKYAYLSGSKIFCLESGDELLESFGYTYPCEHELCREYRDVLDEFNNLIKNDKRPYSDPKTKVAFVYGNHDAWSGVPGSGVVWGQFSGKHWGVSDAEHSWRILDDVNRSVPYYDITNHGNNDFGCTVPYGQYDIIPDNTPADVLSKYEAVVFVGWNSMTDEIYHNISEYVKNGGKLIMSVAHLNTSVKRDEKSALINNGDFSELFGCKVCGEYESKDGFKFAGESLIPGMKYSGPKDYSVNPCDPWWNGGYTKYAKMEMCGAKVAAVLENSFIPLEDNSNIALCENKFGKGYALLLTSTGYPGSNAVYPIYRIIVGTLLSHIHSQCDIKVIAGDKLKFSVYDDNTVYLLNTDYDCRICPLIIKDDKKTEVVLEPGEMKKIQM